MDNLRLTLLNTWTSIYPPLGLLYISAYLKKYLNFSNISLVESEKTELGVARRVLRTKPDLVGITSSTPTINQVVAVAKEIKEEGIPIILGGPHITSLPHRLPNEIDVGVIGEGEQTMIDLMDHFLENRRFIDSKLSNIEGISFYAEGKVVVNKRRELINPLDSLSFPDRTILDMPRYLRPTRLFVMKEKFSGTTMITSRGCPYRCIYCQASQQWGSVRYHSPEYVVSEIEFLKKTYPINAINIVDDLFIVNCERLARIVELIKKRDLEKGLSFNVNGRADLINRDVLELLKSINVKQISYGFESGSEKILNYLKKGSVSIEQNRKAATLTNEYGIGVGGQFMLGTPGETKEDILKTLDFIKNHKMSHVHLSVTMPLPGTELWRWALDKGYVSEEMDWDQLDFGDPIPNFILEENFYMNDAVSREEFNKLLNLINQECDKINPKSTIFNNGIFPLFKKAVLNPKKAVKYILKRILNIW